MKQTICRVLLLGVSGVLAACGGEKAPSVPTAAPTSAATSAPASEEAIAVAQEFVDLLVTEEYAEAVKLFDGAMTSALPPGKLQEIWEGLMAQVGAYQRQVGARGEKQGPYDIVFVTLGFERANLDAKVVLDDTGHISGLWFVPTQVSSESQEYRPPAYVDPGRFQEEEVIVGAAEWALPGTLTLARGEGPFPAVVLVHGSGPQDRDETIGPNKPFRDLAWGLASQGIAVLRYEKRTKAYADKLASMKEEITVNEEAVDDALAAVELLRKTEGIDPARVFVLGHSLGGMLVPRIGDDGAEIAGFIVMAGTSRPLEDVVLEQVRYISELDGTVSQEERARLDEIGQQVARIKDPGLTDGSSGELLLGAPPAYWLDLRGYNPPEVAATLYRPMLILQGERDYQVTLEDLEGWKQALSSKPNVTFQVYPTLNHLLITGEGTITPAEYEVAGHVDEGVIDDIADWVKQN